jgi:phosphate transport system permease protein
MSITQPANDTVPRPPAPGYSDSAGRRRIDKTATAGLYLVLAAVIAVLAWVLIYVASQGAQAISLSFLTDTPPGAPSTAGGGFANGIVGSLIIVGIATVISVPIGMGTAIYLHEYATTRSGNVVRFLSDVLVGIPTIVTGAFVYILWVTHFGFSGYAGAIALAIVMLPLVVRSTEEMLRLVPIEVREASWALGITRSKTIWSIVLPSARSGITTGVMLAVARAMGETAPLLLTALGNDLFMETHPGNRMSTLSMQIFGNAITGYQTAQARAWAGALTLIAIVLVLTILARLLGRRGATHSS